MLDTPKAEDLLKNCMNRYELVIAISKRARQLTDGDEIKINTNETSKVTIASKEFEQEKYKIIREN